MNNAREGYKQTELGEIPIDWEVVVLGNYLIKHEEKSTTNNQYPVLTSSRRGLFLQNEYYTRNVASEDNTGYNVVPRGYFTYRHMSDDLIFKFNLNNIVDKGIVSTLYPVFTTQKLDDYFLKTKLNDGFEFKNFAAKQKQGGTRTYVYYSKLEKLKIILPPLEEQKKITEILTTVDNQIEKTEQLIGKSKELKKGLMQQLLTKGIGHKEYYQSELGELPKEWRVKKLSLLSEKITDGSHYSPQEVEESSYKICSVKHMLNSEINFKNGISISSEDYTKLVHNNCKPENDDVLLSKDGTVGKTFVFKQGHENIVLLSSIAIIRLKNEELIPLFLKFYFENPSTILRIIGMKSGSAIKRIVLRDINSLLVVVPPLDEQKRIASILSSVDDQIESYEQEKANYEQLKKGLMQQLLTGQLRVKV